MAVTRRQFGVFATMAVAASALAAWSDDKAISLIGLMPVVSLWRAYRIPLPALVSAHPYGTLCTPPLDRNSATDAVARLMHQARNAGAHALILRDISLKGAAMRTITESLLSHGIRPHVLQCQLRACLDATRDAEELLRALPHALHNLISANTFVIAHEQNPHLPPRCLIPSPRGRP